MKKNKVEVKVTENAEVAWYLIKKQEPVAKIQLSLTFIAV